MWRADGGGPEFAGFGFLVDVGGLFGLVYCGSWVCSICVVLV